MQLVVNQGVHQGTFIPITRRLFAIGRDETCQLRLRSEEVSRRHAELKMTAKLVLIRDLGSRNGTTVNGRRLNSIATLRHGDRVEIGPLSFTVLMEMSGQEWKAHHSVDDEIAAWLVGTEEEEPASEGFELNNADTAESEILPERPQGQGIRSGATPPPIPPGEAFADPRDR